MLHGLDPRPEVCLVIVGQDRHGLLGDDRATVERLVDEVDGHAGDPHPVRQRVANGVCARERGQQRRVGVEDAAAECIEHARPDHAHVAGQHDHIGSGTGQHRSEGLVLAAVDHRRVDARFGGPVERGAVAVRKHQHDVAAELAALCGRLERPQVRARTGHADRDPPVHAIDSNRPST